MSNYAWLRTGLIITVMWISATVSMTIYELMNTQREACCFGVATLKMLRCEADTSRPAATPWDKAADSQGKPRWVSQVVQPGLQSIDPAQRTEIRNQYWTSVVAPTLAADEKDGARSAFEKADDECAFAVTARVKVPTLLVMLFAVPLLAWGVGYAILRGRKAEPPPPPGTELSGSGEVLPESMRLGKDD